ncbi:MAG: PrsW family intramembrane metalloprotease [Firmicutes bacterium]|nr:PrsW family intramembrane metalloprotease [Candidatus Colimorpha enterica]
MDSVNYILFICVAAPALLMLLPIEKHSRKVIVFLLIGMFACLFVSEVNGMLYGFCRSGIYYFTTNITPVTEEIVKILPILYYSLLFSNKRHDIITVSFATGVGFAILENLIVLIQNQNNIDFGFAIARGFSSGLMHCICTVFVGFFAAFANKSRKTFLVGTVSSLTLAIVYHSIFNLLVQADSVAARHVGLFLPLAAYILLSIFSLVRKKQR